MTTRVSNQNCSRTYQHWIFWVRVRGGVQLYQEPASVMILRCISAFGTGNSHICEGTIYAQWYLQILGQHMPQSVWRLHQARSCLFQHSGGVQPPIPSGITHLSRGIILLIFNSIFNFISSRNHCIMFCFKWHTYTFRNRFVGHEHTTVKLCCRILFMVLKGLKKTSFKQQLFCRQKFCFCWLTGV